MAPTNQRAGKKPNADNLAAATAPGRLQKADDVDPVLGTSHAQPPAAGPTPPSTPAPAQSAPKAKTEKPQKASFYTSREDLDRMRATWNNLPVGAKPKTFSQFMHNAIMEKVAEYEQAYNHGEPWPPQPAGSIATGPPVGG